MNTIEEYLNTVKIIEHKKRLETIFDWIYINFPQLEVKIKWNQPMFIHNGTFIIAFTVAKKHISFSPEGYTINAFSDEIIKAGYEHKKYIAMIKWSDEINYLLLRKIIEFNIETKKDSKTFFRKT